MTHSKFERFKSELSEKIKILSFGYHLYAIPLVQYI